MAEQTGWLSRLAGALSGDSDAPIRVNSKTAAELLRVARDVAHGTDRVNAPLSTYVAGRYVAARLADDVDEETALQEFADAVSRLLADPQPE